MRIEFSYQANPGLRIIDEISDGKIVWVRGYNGVGKSLAAKLLEIASGSHVFDNKSEFNSLMTSLHRARIKITLNRGKELIVIIEPKKWVFDDVTRMIKHESVGTFHENDKIISAKKFGTKFEARIIKGNESLPTQISALITQSLEQFRRLGTISGEIKNLSTDFRDMVVEELDFRDIREFDRVKKQLIDTEKNIMNSNIEIENVEHNIDLMSKLLGIQNNIQIHNEYNIDDLLKEIKMKESIVEKLETRYKELQNQREEQSFKSRQLIERESVRYDAIVNDMRSAKKRRDNINKNILNKISEVDLTYLPEKGFLKRLKRRANKLKKEEKIIEQEKKQERIVDEVLTKQSNITSILTNIEPELDISDETIAHGKLPTFNIELDISVDELRDMIEVQEVILLEKKKESSFKDYDENLERIVDQQNKLNDILKLWNQLNNIENQIRELESKLKSLVVSDKTKYGEYLKRLGDIDEEIKSNQLLIARTIVDINIMRKIYDDIKHMPSLEVLISERKDIARKLSIDEFKQVFLKDKFDELKGISMFKHKELRDLKSKYIYLKHKNLELEENFQRIVKKLKKDKKYEYIKEWIGRIIDKKPIEILRNIRDNLENFVNEIGEIEIRLGDIQKYHEELINIIAEKPSEFSETPQVKKLEEIFNIRLKDFYSREIFLKYVFEGFTKLESFDLRQNQVSLIDTNRKVQTKPISSFSTGQKAFAFSVAMMSLVFSKPSKNRVLFLDEFGALLDYMREDILMEQVQSKILDENKVQKIVILLPVRERLEDVLDDLHIQKKSSVNLIDRKRLEREIKRYSTRMNQLKEKGYYQEIENAS